MKLKMDGDAAVLQDGKPVYVKDDGTEIAFDGAQAFAKIGQLTGENTDYKRRFTDAETRLKAFEGIEDAEAARRAIETVANLDAGELKTAAQVAEIKAAAVKAAEEQVKAAATQAQATIKQLTVERDGFQANLYAERIGGNFSRSKVVLEKLILPPDIAEATFGKHFKIEDGKTVAYDAAGNKIYSTSRPGELADFDESLEALVNAYPNKDAILRSNGQSGSGAQPNGGGAPGAKTIGREAFARLDPAAQAQVGRDVNAGKMTITD